MSLFYSMKTMVKKAAMSWCKTMVKKDAMS